MRQAACPIFQDPILENVLIRGPGGTAGQRAVQRHRVLGRPQTGEAFCRWRGLAAVTACTSRAAAWQARQLAGSGGRRRALAWSFASANFGRSSERLVAVGAARSCAWSCARQCSRRALVRRHRIGLRVTLVIYVWCSPNGERGRALTAPVILLRSHPCLGPLCTGTLHCSRRWSTST